MDKRIKKTRKTIQKGVYELYITPNKTNYSVTELCEFIKINRTTFYLHYKRIENVIDDMQNKVLEDLKNILTNNIDSISKMIHGCVEYIVRQPKGFKNLFSNNQTKIFLLVKNMVSPLLLRDQKFEKLSDGIEREYVMDFIVSGSINVFRTWIERDCKDDVNSLLSKFVEFFDK